MDTWTSFPGLIVPSEQSMSIIGSFQEKYHVDSFGKSVNLPTWCLFPENSRVDMNILKSVEFSNYDTVYFYFENGKEIYIATPQQVEDYFEERNPWETDWDLYVFDSNLCWCIAFTHEQMDGSEVILVGQLK